MQRKHLIAENLARAVSDCLWADLLHDQAIDAKDGQEIGALLDDMMTWREGCFFGALQAWAQSRI